MTYYIAAIGLLALSSCSGFLDQPTDTRIDPTTDDQLRQVLVTSYPEYNYALPCELFSDNMEDNNAPDKDGLRYNLSSFDLGDDEMFAFEQCKANSGTDSPFGIWQGFYKSIAGANAVLEKLEEKAARQGGELNATQKALKGEALMIRAYGHFILAQVFCQAYAGEEKNKTLLGIPYITKPEITVKPHYERGTLDVTYANIEKDILEGLPLIDNSLYTISKYHFNTQASHAFAARYYLFTRQYKKCIEECNLAFGGADVNPETYMSDVLLHTSDFYYISDFGLYEQNVTNAHNFLLVATYSSAFRRFRGYRYAVTRDARSQTLQGPGPTWTRYKFHYTNGKGSDFYMNPAFSSAQANGKSEYGSYFPKNISEQFELTNKIAQTGYSHVTRSEFTGEEVLLTRAEAKLFSGDVPGGLEDLRIYEAHLRNNYGKDYYGDEYTDFTEQAVRDFYNGPLGDIVKKPINIDLVCPSEYSLTDNIEPLVQCAIHFRRLEMIHTGMRYFDIKRLGIEFTRKIGKSRVETLSLNDARRAMPLPAEIVAAGMLQNPVNAENEPSSPMTSHVTLVK